MDDEENAPERTEGVDKMDENTQMISDEEAIAKAIEN